MPTNLPPEYFQADKRFHEAQTPAERIARMEELISTVPKHKGTDHLRADLRRQLSRLKEDAQAHKKQSARQATFHVEREGAGQAALVGATNVGKSALVAALTHAQPEVSEAPYTTWTPLPGMMPIENIQVQLVDTPPMEASLVEPALFDLIRHVDLLLLVVDLEADPLQQLQDTLDLLAEHRIAPLEAKDKFVEEERMVRLPALVLVNKYDDETLDEAYAIFQALLEEKYPLIPLSAKTGRNFDRLKRKVYERLEIVRVYAKPPGKNADLEKPFVMKMGSTITDLARKIHRDFFENLKAARVWGGSEFDGQAVQRDYVLQEGDIVELRM
ncbi:MAG: TGS domain-containing protein [Chloroflexi bacterium]|nr:MAG: TGS domain-containing protein [Chloroflexota bacterium]